MTDIRRAHMRLSHEGLKAALGLPAAVSITGMVHDPVRETFVVVVAGPVEVLNVERTAAGGEAVPVDVKLIHGQTPVELASPFAVASETGVVKGGRS